MWIQISSGKGPDECELAVSLFMKEYIKELNKSGLEVVTIEAAPGNIPGNLKSVLLSLDDSQDISSIDIKGTILWSCKSPYRPYHKRKNWFIDVESFKASEHLCFSERDVKFEALRSSGPGGQNVNKVETAVRATHMPSGLSVTASEERSQHMNKKINSFFFKYFINLQS